MSNANPSPETRFKPGESGNPKGKPKGALCFKTVVKQILEEEGLDETGERLANIVMITRKVLDRAKTGNLKAYEILADRAEGKPVQRVENKHEGDITLFLSNVEKKAKDVEDPAE